METNQEQIHSMPRIGDKAPSFTAKTTQGIINFPEDLKVNGKFFSVTLPILLLFVLLNS